LREDDAELADKILEILRDEKLRSELSVNAYEQSLQINSIDKYREEIFRVYKECVNDKGYEISAE
jgi:glycosyltransferase involved in cell wall biosynthesis